MLDFGQLRAELGDALVTDRVDSSASADDQIGALLNSGAECIALVAAGEYKALMRREDAERDVLRQLARPSPT